MQEADFINKPCNYTEKRKSDDYEIYSYDAFRYKTEDELRTSPRIDQSFLDSIRMDGFFAQELQKKPNLANMDKETRGLMEGFLNKDGLPTVCGIMLFGKYPQYLSPNLDIVAVVCPTVSYAEENAEGERFLVNKRIDGTIPQMLESAISFVVQNMKTSTVIDETGHRRDVPEYPIKAIREILLNALIHRDYSIHTENEPIRIEMYPDCIEVSNPGGLYGRLTVDGLGKTKADVRNPFLASALETMELTENRYSGIPTICREMEKARLREPLFESTRGMFKVTLFNKTTKTSDMESRILDYCQKPRTRESLATEFGFDGKHPAYFIRTYIMPLVDEGKLQLTLPNKPRSKNQRFITSSNEH
ncbi:MAG: hypothetical protein KBS81_07045 [Spirochaetales bacterium]|nr:hypothetical protein [Candidatus Physcosoma equi]